MVENKNTKNSPTPLDQSASENIRTADINIDRAQTTHPPCEEQLDRSSTTEVSDKLDLKVAIGWAIGSVATSTLLFVVNTLYLKYIVDHLLISATLAATILAATRVFDAAIDPLMGSISDHTRSRWGRRRPYLLIGGILCALSVVLLFSDPLGVALYSPPIYVAVTLCIYAIGYTVFNVPYITMSYELTESPKQRTSLMSYRVYAMGAAGIMAQALAPWIVTEAGGGLRGFAMVGWAMCLVVLLSCLTAFFATSNARVVPVKKTGKRPRLRDMRTALGNKPFIRLILAKSAYLFGVGIQAAALAFFVTTALQQELKILGALSASLLACLIISQPLWVRVCNKFGKRTAFFIAAPMTVLVNLSWLLAEPGEPTLGFIIRGIVIGFCGGGINLAIQAMLPDVLQHEAERSSSPQEGVLAGIFTTVERGVAAGSVAAAGIVMGIGGYVAGQSVQSESAIQSLYICVAVMPCIGAIGGALILRGYTLRS